MNKLGLENEGITRRAALLLKTEIAKKQEQVGRIRMAAEKRIVRLNDSIDRLAKTLRDVQGGCRSHESGHCGECLNCGHRHHKNCHKCEEG